MQGYNTHTGRFSPDAFVLMPCYINSNPLYSLTTAKTILQHTFMYLDELSWLTEAYFNIWSRVMKLTEEEVKLIHEPCDKMQKLLLDYIELLKERIQLQEKLIANLEEINKNLKN